MGKKTFFGWTAFLALILGTVVQAEVFVDDFNTPQDYIVDGVEGTIWDDFVGLNSNETVDALNASLSRPGQLYMASTGGYWDGAFSPLGPFLYKVVKGDFIASVKVTGYAGTSASPVLHNDGGLMARAFVEDAGPGEDWISIDYFPIWTCGNFLWQAINNDRNEAFGCNNGKQWNLDPWLQLERQGNVFHVRTSVDGVNWTEISCSPKTRNDFDGLPLMVGLRHATYSGTTGYVAFDNFSLEVIIRPKAYAPSPADKAWNVLSTHLTWKPGYYAAQHDVYVGTSLAEVDAATVSTPGIYKGRQDPNAYTMSSLVPDTAYYWRIDEVNDAHPDKVWKGDIWSFTVIPLTAWNPTPADHAQCVPSNAGLSWSAGSTANQHEVYFGKDETAVASATTTNPLGVYKGKQAGTAYDPGNLAKDTTYFWRVDEVEQDGSTRYQGEVLSFTTLADIPLFDSHLVGWWKLDGGCANNDIVVDSSGYNRHGTVKGNPQWVPGYDQGALDFDGRGTYVDLPIGDLIGSLTRSTFMTWANFSNSGGAWQRIFDFGTDPNNHMYFTPRQYFIQPMSFGISTNGTNEISATDDATMPSGWHHVAVTINPAANTIILYLDGVEAVRSSTASLIPKDLGKTTNNWLGRSENILDGDYLGSLDDFRIYDYALTVGEIGRAMIGNPFLSWNPLPRNGSSPDVLHVSPLSWSPGQDAVKHDLYFGVDANAVSAADRSDTTGIYRGTLDVNSFSLSDLLEWNRTYSWRVDEQGANGTITRGRVWTFTTANFLVVDDMESYDDICNRIYFAWVDGAGHPGSPDCGVAPATGSGSGSIVGNPQTPFAERTTVHSGTQSMPFWYNNSVSPYYSETAKEWAIPQVWTQPGVSTLTVFLQGAAMAFREISPGTFIMNGTGTDIWNASDEFRFAYKQLKGNGSIIARVDAVANTNTYAKAGVMIRESLDPASTYAITVMNPSNRIGFERRATTGLNAEATTQEGIVIPCWVKITRTGNAFTAQYSADGTTWMEITPTPAVSITMTNDVYIGLAVTSHAASVVCGAKFSNVSTSGTVTGSWQTEDIGVTQVEGTNTMDPFYLMVQDSAGKSTLVSHPDRSVVATGNWEQWDIPLTQFTSAGVNVGSVKKMVIGVGDRGAPKAGGTGKLLIDDIRLTKVGP